MSWFFPSSFHVPSVLLWTNPSPRTGVLLQIPAQWEQFWCFFLPGLAIETHPSPLCPSSVALLANLSLGSTRYWTIATAFQLAPCFVFPLLHYGQSHLYKTWKSCYYTSLNAFQWLPISNKMNFTPVVWLKFSRGSDPLYRPFFSPSKNCTINVEPTELFLCMLKSSCLFAPHLATATPGSVLVPF